MAGFIESWVRAKRLSRAVIASIVGIAIIVWWVFFGPPGMTSRETVKAQVISITEAGSAVVELPDGGKVMLIRPGLHEGDRVPMIVEHYDDGTRGAFFDETAWRMQ